jgi:PAS domain S-box-containing protein
MINDIDDKELTIDEFKKFNNALKKLHLVLTQNHKSHDDLINEYLKIGSEIYNLETGIVSHIKNNDYTVMGTNAAAGTIEKGQVFEVEGTYCVEVYNSNSSVALSSIGLNSKMNKHPVYIAMKLESYISSPIFVNDELYGTINFTSITNREEGFKLYEIEMLEIMALNIGKFLELSALNESYINEKITKEAKQKEILEQKDFYEDILNGMHDGYVVQDKSGSIIQFNKSSFQILGLTEDELLGKKSIDPEWRCTNITGEPFPGEEHPSMISLNENKSSEGVIMGILTPKNEQKWISINSRPLYHDEQGLPTHAMTTFSDVTKQTNFQKLLSRSKQKAERASKTKTEFLANMSHEIRTPLNGIVGMVSLLEDTNLSDDQKDILSTIQSSSDLLLAVINDVLDISKIEVGKTELYETSFNLKKGIKDSFDLFKEKANEKNITYKLEIENDFPEFLHLDELKCKQIFNNLISNAIKFTDSGEVSISCKAIKRAGSTFDIHFTVIDSGIGVEIEKRQKLFKAFSQADISTTRNYGGTGLGLIICKKLAQLMNGDVVFEPNKGGGSRFTFSVRFQAADKVIEKDNEILTIRNDLKILLVEDNQVNSTIVTRMLDKVGVKIDLAINGAIACDLVHKTEYDIILMDLQMPVMDGLTATHQILTSHPNRKTKIIAMTANAFEEDKNACFEIGMVDFISKPIKKEKLYSVIKENQ